MEQSKRIKYDKNGNMLIEGIKVVIKPNSFKVSDYFKKQMADIELQYKNAAIDETTYYKNMESLRNKYLEKGTKEWWTYTTKLIDYENKLIKEKEKAAEEERKRLEKEEEKRQKQLEKDKEAAIKMSKEELAHKQKLLEEEKEQIFDVYSDIASYILKTQKELEREQASFMEKLWGATDEVKSKKLVFVGQGKFGSDLTVKESYLEDLKSQSNAIKEYYKLLMAVNERGAELFGEDGFRDFFSMLRGLSIEEGASLASLLMKEKDDGFFEFVADWSELQSTIDRFTKSIYAQDTKKLLDDSYEYMEKTLEENGLLVPEGFFLSGQLSAEKFGEGFISEIDEILKNIEREFEDMFPNRPVSEPANLNNGNSVFSPVYHLYGSGETVSEKLRSAMAQAMVERLRGGY